MRGWAGVLLAMLVLLPALLPAPSRGEGAAAETAPSETLAPAAGVRAPAWVDVGELRRRVRPREEGGARVWEYELTVSDEELLLADGSRYKVWAFGGTVPGPPILAREGDRVRIRLINETSVAHTIHSHGLWVPHRMDGVPHALAPGAPGGAGGAEGLPAWTRPVPPGESFTYEYIARPAGTHFYHCHMSTSEHLDRGMSGPLIVLPRDEEPPVDRDVVLLLDEWDTTYAREGVPGDPRRLSGYDIFTLNGRSFPDTEPLELALGEVARVRLIHAGAVPHYLHLHGHAFLVTHRDGAPLAEPLILDTVEIGPGQQVDLLIAADNPGVWPFHCHTVAHVTNAGAYPGGMLTQIQVGPEPFPATGEGPAEGALRGSLEELRRRWRAFARRGW